MLLGEGVPILAVVYCTKKVHVNSVGHTRDEKNFTALHNIIGRVPWARIYLVKAFISSNIHCLGDKSLCMGSQ